MEPPARRRPAGAPLGVGATASALPPTLRKAVADAGGKPGSLAQIEHVVVLMQENRSFDHYFGSLPGVRGFGDPDVLTLCTGQPVWYQPDPKNPQGYELPFHLDTATTGAAGATELSHAWEAQHASWNGGTMDNWIPAHRAADGEINGPLTMGYFTGADLPFHYALADAFTICDNYHCSVLGPTNPNRLYHWTGTIDPARRNGGPVIDNSETPPYTWTTYPERLEAAGTSWRIYQEADNYDDNPLAWFRQYQEAPNRSPLFTKGIAPAPSLVEAFAGDVRDGNLPQVSWIIGPAATCEHPSYLPAAGAVFISQILEVLAAHPKVWAKTVFFLNYDENDGLFDHVPPPVPPAGTADEFVDRLPIGLGFRVPMIVISPLSVGGWVSSEAYDRTSVLRFMEELFGVEEPNISAWRRRCAGDLTRTLNVPSGRTSFPALPQTRDYLLSQYVTSQDQPAPTVPADQTLPIQPPGHRRPTP